ncbi:hypothetical protein [Enterovibrio nigricans]|uniref:hypothetical protein n=1 Tax=Enterovibrio nigricans TaxID=504469 RepID=UPI001482AF53|nr:hypothetical protein [Enterovibrio nigricans]
MRLRRLMGVADQIVASRFSSIDLSNKAAKRQTLFGMHDFFDIEIIRRLRIIRRE